MYLYLHFKTITVHTKYILPLFLLVQIVLLQFFPFFPEIFEQYYSNGIYPFISRFFRLTLGGLPFSVGDCIYLVLIFMMLRWFWNTRKSWRQKWSNNLLTILSTLSIFYFLFHILWGLNYYRKPLFEKMKIEREYSQEDLLGFTDKLIAKTNAIQLEITKNKTLKVVNPYKQEKIFAMSTNGYTVLASEYPFLNYSNPSIKKSLFSLPLTYMGFGGYLNPFTNEAQVNYKVPKYGFPLVICHEMAHQMGFASESECNFIGFLATIKNKDLYFQYSGYVLALKYCLGNIQDKDPIKAKIYFDKLNSGIIINFKEDRLFWEHYESFIETGFHIFYDHFLKINQQKEGIESYSKFVDLLVNYYKEKEF